MKDIKKAQEEIDSCWINDLIMEYAGYRNIELDQVPVISEKIAEAFTELYHAVPKAKGE